ncbi:hypothetical protein EON79_22565 [bacterium]|nr:MAG: hypothetical protein EON79_22565 [bacterium]
MPDRPSVFTSNLLRGLNGMGANDDRGAWCIDTTKLQRVLSELAGDFAAPEHLGLPPPIGGEQSFFEFHRLHVPPVVPFYLDLTWREHDEEPPARILRVAVHREGSEICDWPTPWVTVPEFQWENGRFRSDQIAGMRYGWSVSFDDGTSQSSEARSLNPPLRLVEFPRDVID